MSLLSRHSELNIRVEISILEAVEVYRTKKAGFSQMKGKGKLGSMVENSVWNLGITRLTDPALRGT